MVSAVRLLSFLVFLVAPALAADSAYLRVNQLGYQIGISSRAYLMAPGPEHNTSFRVVRADGTQAFSSRIGAKSGKWGVFTVYPLDFNVGAAGTYTIIVDGTFPATSPSFR